MGQDLLSEPLSIIQNVFGPQIVILRCRTVPVLRDNRGGRHGGAVRGIF